MRLIRAKDYNDASRKMANLLSAQVVLKPDCVLGLATGSSPVGTYKELIRRCANGDLDFSQVRTVNLDEYVGLSPEHDQSYAYFMHHNLFDHINIAPENVHLPDGLDPDAERQGKLYDDLIHSLGGVDMQLLGIGHDGHIGFNEPCDTFVGKTHEVELEEITREANKRFFNSIDEVPTAAYTMGIGTVMSARKILLVATGKDKAEIVKKSFFGPVTPMVPASILQFHPDVTVIADEAALSLID